ncbi:MAG: hypothetical protein ABI625_20790, partial [bacterium]
HMLQQTGVGNIVESADAQQEFPSGSIAGEPGTIGKINRAATDLKPFPEVQELLRFVEESGRGVVV